MSFSASLDGGRFEYSLARLGGLLAQPANAVRPRMWRMVRDLLCFYRETAKALGDPGALDLTLGACLTASGYGEAFVRDHLLPMGAAIWPAPVEGMLDYPLVAFVRFCDNHGLLTLSGRPQWRTVGGRQSVLRREPDRSHTRPNPPQHRRHRHLPREVIQRDTDAAQVPAGAEAA
jgi:predicted NAD/FAD-binding protein